MEGKTISAVHEGGSVRTVSDWLDPERDADLIYNSHWLSVEDGKVIATQQADYVIEFTDGTVATVTSCGCCGGAELDLQGTPV